MTLEPISRIWTARRVLIAIALLLWAIVAALFFLRHLEDGPVVFNLAQARTAKDMSVVFASGDAGLRTWSIGGQVAERLATDGYSVTGIDSLAEFSRRRTVDETAAILARAIAQASARNPGRPVALIGQSFGADMLVVAIDRLPDDVRAKIGRLVLIVPGTHAYLKISPGEVLGIDPPDVALAPLAARLPQVPVTCIFGVEEEDSLCRILSGPNVTSLGLPGGHMLNRDSNAVFGVVARALRVPVQPAGVAPRASST